jgi:hypothetical protein
MTQRKDVPHARDMVGWFDPPVLAQSAWLVAVSNVFGRHSDTRLIEALSGLPQSKFEYTNFGQDFWFDFVCDTGDGWDSTYAIANALAQPEVVLRHDDGTEEATQRGAVLIFGGDEVYPYPSQREYVSRTEAPYEAAFRGRARLPEIFALPGNHDWYDSLIAFSRTFCRPERGFAGCKTRQTRSYFALQLPGDWWFIGLDLQLGAEMDEPQTVYFKQIAETMSPRARLILCVPEPRWILEQAYPRYESYSEDSATAFLEQKVFKRKVSVFLTGDLHFYKRHENADGIQKITSGGGGAFLHPTHAPSTKTLRDGFVERAAFPDEVTSRRLAWRNLLFPVLNPKYMILPAFVYALSAWLASASLGEADVVSVESALNATVHAAVRDPFNGLWLITFIVAFVFFTDTHVRWWRIIGGVSHALSQLVAAFAVGWVAYLLTVQVLGLSFATLTQLVLSGALTFVLGGVVGGFMMGLYLLVSVQVFGRHSNEAFSSLRIMDYKQWLRLRISPDGALSIYCIGLDRVPRRWRKELRAQVETFSPDDARATAPRLIDFVKLR